MFIGRLIYGRQLLKVGERRELVLRKRSRAIASSGVGEKRLFVDCLIVCADYASVLSLGNGETMSSASPRTERRTD